ncbi:hypothetical protein WUBG_15576 [Wuchereria bancrofti]|uniref:Uncharacterized protein n=1 Tax=Wuchereria bancrofti TaxID=6293 RepID=J9DUY3_WUCBA|nr:hypothetical protein WUBG_15576 [Wuchereria bancrofti]
MCGRCTHAHIHPTHLYVNPIYACTQRHNKHVDVHRREAFTEQLHARTCIPRGLSTGTHAYTDRHRHDTTIGPRAMETVGRKEKRNGAFSSLRHNTQSFLALLFLLCFSAACSLLVLLQRET